MAEWFVEAPWGNRKRGRENGSEAWLGIGAHLPILCAPRSAGLGRERRSRLPTLDPPQYWLDFSQSCLIFSVITVPREGGEIWPQHSHGPLDTHTRLQSRVFLGTETAAHEDGQGAETEDVVRLLHFRADLRYLPPLTWR